MARKKQNPPQTEQAQEAVKPQAAPPVPQVKKKGKYGWLKTG